MQDVFEVGEVVPITTHRWLVRGQAWQTFRVGDQMYAAVGRSYKTVIENDRAEGFLVDPGVVSREQPFTVISVSIYRRDIDTLYRGLTGEIILEGEGGEILKENTLLVKL